MSAAENLDLEAIQDVDAKLWQAIKRSQALIECDLSGTILSANEQFLTAFGYSLDEIIGQNHSLLCDESILRSFDNQAFWEKLSHGQPCSGHFKRQRKDGSEIWLQASYIPVTDDSGRISSVIKLATDMTKIAMEIADVREKISAINRYQLVVELTSQGTILSANENFLETMGYSLDEIIGKHHRIFCDPTFASRKEYRELWTTLSAGQEKDGQFQHIDREGNELWLQSSYIPILNENCDVIKIVKVSTNISESKREILNREQRLDVLNQAKAVADFNTDGTIISANKNFLDLLGYTLDELEGKHLRTLFDIKYAKSKEYKDLWGKLIGGVSESGEFYLKTKMNEKVWIKATYSPIVDTNGKVTKIIKISSDINSIKLKNAELEEKLTPLLKNQAIVEFDLDGTVISANETFLFEMGYKLEEVKGRHHRIFFEASNTTSEAYQNFWKKLKNGLPMQGEYKCLGKDRRDIWVKASYHPINDSDGNIAKIMTMITVVTQEKIKSFGLESQINAVETSQAVIEFDMNGKVLKANENFLKSVGYTFAEINGQHHRIFCEESLSQSQDYSMFWERLNRGECQTGDYKRLAKGQRPIYIKASYNPICDLNGKPFKVVTFTTDLTQEKEKYANLVESFDEASRQLGNASEELAETSRTLMNNTGVTSNKSTSATSLAEDVAIGIVNVVASSEELATSVKEIAEQASEASRISLLAMEESNHAGDDISNLGEASREISQVIKVISSIAQQTNLLALNATIEAARAGDAGRGFAVVANEVKELAKQTAHATEDITQKITGIQSSTQKAISSNKKIGVIIHKLNDIAAATAAAAKEQTATTNEVTSTLSESQQGVEEISNLIRDVSAAAMQNAKSAEDATHATKRLLTLANLLSERVAESKLS